MTDPWPWAPAKEALQQYDALAGHPAAPVPQDEVLALIQWITADPYGAGSTESDIGPEWDRVAAFGNVMIPYQVHDPDRNPNASQRCVLILRVVWAD
ncbi:hypothetical protein ACFP1Z_03710 [Streptomyces gamaensis]|uniref:Uncharacterized protein n=1 Tax=Streptomyces gamaensis TaxID=1763542 RepID=A0ABW0YT01_9ACTN